MTEDYDDDDDEFWSKSAFDFYCDYICITSLRHTTRYGKHQLTAFKLLIY